MDSYISYPTSVCSHLFNVSLRDTRLPRAIRFDFAYGLVGELEIFLDRRSVYWMESVKPKDTSLDTGGVGVPRIFVTSTGAAMTRLPTSKPQFVASWLM